MGHLDFDSCDNNGASKPILTPQSDGTIVVEYNLTLDPMTESRVTLDYEPVLLPFQRFPADPNRGIEMPPTLFTFRFDCAGQNHVLPSFLYIPLLS